MVAAVGAIVGREAELAVLARFVGGVGAGARALLLVGEPGIGKSTLWEVALELARDAGCRVRSCRPAEVETAFSYAALGDLLHDDLDDVLGALEAPQRRALEIALLRRESDGAPPDQRAVALSVLRALEALSAEHPLLVAVDDVQWLDRPSARALTFAIRRLQEARVGVLASLRLALEVEDALDLRGTLGDRGTRRLHVGPLGEADLGRMLRTRFTRSLPHPLVARVHEATNGNPLFALEVVRAVGGSEPSPGEPLPVPDDLREVLRARVGRLSLVAREALLLASAMARPTASSVREAHRGAADTAAGIAEAEEAGIVTIERDRIRFTHPLLASTVYWSSPAARRGEAHLRLAGTASDLEERARHLALAAEGPDERLASLAESAAWDVRWRGAPAAAAELAELACKLTPADEEGARLRRGRRAALNRFDAGDPPGAREMLETLLRGAPAGVERARLHYELSVTYWNDVGRCRELVLRALDEGEGDPNLLARAWGDLAFVEIHGGSLERAARHATEGIALAEPLENRFPLRLALGALGTALALMGRDASDVMARALSLEDGVWSADTEGPAELLGRQHLWAGDLDRGRTLFLEELHRYADRGFEALRWEALLRLAELECQAGNWAEAADRVAEANEIVLDAGLEEILDHVLYVRGLVRALTGEVDAARGDASEGLRRAEAQEDTYWAVKNRAVLGFVELSLGRHAEAVGVLDPVPETLEAMGVREPGAFPCLPDLIEALVATGDLVRAKAVTQRLGAQGKALDRPLALATAARGRALIAAALGDLPGAVLELDHALEEHERIPVPFDRARTLLVRGETLRRMKKKRLARESLERALAVFEELGAPLWAERARAGLSRLGGRPATPAGLTATERRVADLVAVGRTNREVADELFVSVRTVEANLRRVYQKLGVRSRTELAARRDGSRDLDR